MYPGPMYDLASPLMFPLSSILVQSKCRVPFSSCSISLSFNMSEFATQVCDYPIYTNGIYNFFDACFIFHQANQDSSNFQLFTSDIFLPLHLIEDRQILSPHDALNFTLLPSQLL